MAHGNESLNERADSFTTISCRFSTCASFHSRTVSVFCKMLFDCISKADANVQFRLDKSCVLYTTLKIQNKRHGVKYSAVHNNSLMHHQTVIAKHGISHTHTHTHHNAAQTIEWQAANEHLNLVYTHTQKRRIVCSQSIYCAYEWFSLFFSRFLSSVCMCASFSSVCGFSLVYQ